MCFILAFSLLLAVEELWQALWQSTISLRVNKEKGLIYNKSQIKPVKITYRHYSSNHGSFVYDIISIRIDFP